ncbi:MerR family transcriptional regulator [Kitasatospora sp. DSM 101779]|uniref:DNA polymerase III subunit beta family protein n=1 Tax=Kitasatospora sp. DSM 101779 TaxID=2853165 RepID=UPI0021D854CC|nr:MerR family transcriptional regulator [Kitasatospora sp. DSM 101779]MCU7825015.1 MerR family transcriptional regulator [Kitasatospora sp. DSM 101779]
MDSGLHSIGETARLSGLSISALRFYDGAGVFGPARVDPQTGYRWYAPEQLADARLIARLRRVGMPLADVSRVLAGRPGEAAAALDAHLRRLEEGLADARRELSTVRHLLELREKPVQTTRLTLPAAELAAALDAVRFAVGLEQHRRVAGVLFEADGAVLRLVATDRYRLAVSEAAPRTVEGPSVAVLAPTAFVDGLRGLLAAVGDGVAELTLAEGALTAVAAGREVTGSPVPADFPDYRPMLRLEPVHRVEVAADVLRDGLGAAPVRTERRDQDGVDFPVSELTVSADGVLTVGGGAAAEDGLCVRVNRDFLLEAVGAGARGQLVLELGGPVAPLAVRFPDRAGTFSLLMPTAP